MTFKVSLDSSIIISHLVGDIHKDDVLLAIARLNRLRARLFFSLVCYAEVWTGIELMDDDEQKEQTAASLVLRTLCKRIVSCWSRTTSPLPKRLRELRQSTDVEEDAGRCSFQIFSLAPTLPISLAAS